MSIGQLESAHNLDDLRQRLERLGIADVFQVIVVTGLEGDDDAGVLFPQTSGQLQVHGVGFKSQDFVMTQVHSLVTELTGMHVQSSGPGLRPGMSMAFYGKG